MNNMMIEDQISDIKNELIKFDSNLNELIVLLKETMIVNGNVIFGKELDLLKQNIDQLINEISQEIIPTLSNTD